MSRRAAEDWRFGDIAWDWVTGSLGMVIDAKDVPGQVAMTVLILTVPDPIVARRCEVGDVRTVYDWRHVE